MPYLLSFIIPLTGLLGMVAAWLFFRILLRYPSSPPTGPSLLVRQGILFWQKRELTVFAILAVLVALGLLAALGWRSALSFMVGSLTAAVAGFWGLLTAVKAEEYTLGVLDQGEKPAMGTALLGGAVAGLFYVSLGIVGLSLSFLLFGLKDPRSISGFALGASFMALFARTSGGIFCRASAIVRDSMAEQLSPSWDPRQDPVVVNSNLGEQLGNVAGISADLYESFTGAVIATMAIAAALLPVATYLWLLLPLLVAAAGLSATLLGFTLLRLIPASRPQEMLRLLHYFCPLVMTLFFFGILRLSGLGTGFFWAVTVGAAAGMAMNLITDYQIFDRVLTRIGRLTRAQPDSAVITVLSSSMKGSALPILIISGAIFAAFRLTAPHGLFGVGLAAVGMLATIGISLILDTSATIAKGGSRLRLHALKNTSLPDSTRDAQELHFWGGQTAAAERGFASASAALTALALFLAYSQVVGLESVDLTNAKVLVGLFLGGVIVFFLAATYMTAGKKAAQKMVEEIRRQEQSHEEGTVLHLQLERFINQGIPSAFKGIGALGAVCFLTPLAVGFLLGPQALGGVLAGAILTSLLLTFSMALAEGAWKGAGGYWSSPLGSSQEQYTPSSIFLDTAGPSMNILMKLMATAALVMAPLFIK